VAQDLMEGRPCRFRDVDEDEQGRRGRGQAGGIGDWAGSGSD
jgi:hypothetical protein